jgi:hypothetical protein
VFCSAPIIVKKLFKEFTELFTSVAEVTETKYMAALSSRIESHVQIPVLVDEALFVFKRSFFFFS